MGKGHREGASVCFGHMSSLRESPISLSAIEVKIMDLEYLC